MINVCFKNKTKIEEEKNVHNSKLDDMENLPINTFYPYCWNLLCFFWHTLTQLLKSFCALLTHPNIHTFKSWYIHNCTHYYTLTATYTTQKTPKRLQKSGWNTETDHDHEKYQFFCQVHSIKPQNSLIFYIYSFTLFF